MTAVEENVSVYQVYPVSRTTSEDKSECSKGWGGWAKRVLTALGRIDVGACYTRGARSRRWCERWGRRGVGWGRGGGNEFELRYGCLER